MSTKTIKKRIALVAASTLTAGFLSVVSAPIANAADGDVTISLISSTTGAAVISNTDASSRQVGWVSATNSAGTVTATLLTLNNGDAQTGVCLSTCSLPFKLENTTDAVGYSVVVTGGVLSSLDETGVGGDIILSGDRKIAVFDLGAGDTNGNLLGIATASSGVTSMTMSFYEGADIEGTTSATAGALLGTLSLTIAPANVAGVYDAGKSIISIQEPYAAGTTASGLLEYDSTTRIGNTQRGAIYVFLKDLYSAAVTTGTITVTATNGAFVNIVDTIPAAGHDYSATSSYDSDTSGLTGGDAYITVTQPVVNVAGSTTVTIGLDGTTIATKTLNWNGDVASIALIAASSARSFLNGAGADVNPDARLGVVYVAKDAAGNAVSLAAQPKLAGATGSMVGASLTHATTTTGVLQTSALGYGAATMVIPTSTLSGTGTYKLRTTNAAGANVDSAAITATVSFGLNSFEVSWDKVTYSSGDLAKLTISGKDIVGNVIADNVPLTGYEGAVAAGFTSVGTACSATRVFSAGKVVCTYSAGNTDGSYSYSFDVTTATAQDPVVGAIKISGNTGTTNAEVLKSIVALIASINKQIAALQKLILKK